MCGGRRSTRNGHIRYHLSEMTILDQGRLEAAACRCYGADPHAYDEILVHDRSSFMCAAAQSARQIGA
jgi:hypothetical protein